MQPAQRRPLREVSNTVTTHSLPREKPKIPVPLNGALIRDPARGTPSGVLRSTPTLSAPPSPRFDDRFRNNSLFVTDYLKEVFDHFKRGEMRRRPSTTYMTTVQSDVNEKMRTILIDWLVDVHLKFKLMPETLFLTTEIIDRFLDKKVVNRQKLQLVGVVALLLAAKYEEIYPPEVKDFIYIAANTYTRDDVLRMERMIFQTLDFNLTLPTMYVFLKRGVQVMEADSKAEFLAQYLAELSLLEYKMLNYLPSVIAASCVYQANKYLGVRDPWPRQMEHYTGYKPSDLERCAADLVQLVRAAPTQKTQAVRKKFGYPKFGEVSKLPQLEAQTL